MVAYSLSPLCFPLYQLKRPTVEFARWQNDWFVLPKSLTVADTVKLLVDALKGKSAVINMSLVGDIEAEDGD